LGGRDELQNLNAYAIVIPNHPPLSFTAVPANQPISKYTKYTRWACSAKYNQKVCELTSEFLALRFISIYTL
jgi:hypothetical protein